MSGQEKTAGELYAEMDAIADRVADKPESYRESEVVEELVEEDATVEGDESQVGEVEHAEVADETESDGQDDDGEDSSELDEGDIEALMDGLDPKDPKQNAIRSALGRVRSKDKTLEQLQQQIQLLLNNQATIQQPLTPPVQDDDGEEVFIDSAKDVERVVEQMFQRRSAESQRQEQQYVNTYMDEFLNLSRSQGWDDDKEARIWSEMYGNDAYKRDTGNPQVDCRMNVLRAEKVLLEREFQSREQGGGEKKPNVRGGGKPQVPLGAAPSSKKQEPKSSIKKVRLDSYAADFIRSRNISEEKAIEILSEETPAQFAR